jgi:hypothetical protein
MLRAGVSSTATIQGAVAEDMKVKRLPRRDRCYVTGRRALHLTGDRAAAAWRILAGELQDMGMMEIPKYRDLLRAIRKATIGARKL